MIEKGIVYEQMIYDIVDELENDVILTRTIINNIAASLGKSPDDIKCELKKVESPFYDNIVGFIDKQPLKRSAYSMRARKVLKKLSSKLSRITKDDIDDAMVVAETIHEHIEYTPKLKWRN